MNRYPINLTQDPEGGLIAQAVDIPEAITFGSDEAEALTEAADALLVALIGYIEPRRDIPSPSLPQKGQPVVILPPLVSAKLALYQAMREQGLTKVELARRLQVTEAVVRRLLDLDHASKIEKIDEALSLLGKRLVVQIEAA